MGDGARGIGTRSAAASSASVARGDSQPGHRAASTASTRRGGSRSIARASSAPPAVYWTAGWYPATKAPV